MRRALPLALLAATMVLGFAPRAAADESIPQSSSSPWRGSTLAATPCSHSLCGLFQRTPPLLGGQYNITVTLEFVEQSDIVCDTPANRLIKEGATVDGRVTFEHDFLCNGSYKVNGYGVGTYGPSSDTSPVLTKNIAVSNPPPTVTDVTATPSTDGRTVTIVWSDMRPFAPDILGYSLERKIGDGEFAALATVGPDINVFDDTTLPDTAGDATYRIITARNDASGANRLFSPWSNEATASYTDKPGGGDGGTDSGADGGTGDGGGGPGGADGGGAAGGTVTTIGGSPGTSTPGGGSPSGRKISAPRLGITGTFLPPLLKPSTAVATTPTTVDSGYDENLPYDPVEPEPDLPGEELAAGDEDDVAGRGMVIPVATGMLMAVWAFHLRFLARASRPGG